MADGPATDHRGSRRLGALEQWIWYVVAGLSYVGLGVYHKWLLNWIVGPAWLVAVVVVGPWMTDRIRMAFGRRTRGDDPGSGS